MNFFAVIVQGFFLTRFESFFLTFYGLRNSSSNKYSSDKGGVMPKKKTRFMIYINKCICAFVKSAQVVYIFPTALSCIFCFFQSPKKQSTL